MKRDICFHTEDESKIITFWRKSLKQRTQAEGKLVQAVLQVGPTALIKEHGFFIPRPGFKFWLHHTEAIQANYLNSLPSSIKGLPSRFTEHTK